MRKRVDDSMYNIGSNIRTARVRADLTQEKMSEMIGVTPQYLSDLERGLVGTSISTLIRICTELNVSSDFILFGNSRFPVFCNGNSGAHIVIVLGELFLGNYEGLLKKFGVIFFHLHRSPFSKRGLPQFNYFL